MIKHQLFLCYNNYGDNMLCPKCKVKLENGSKYCPKCGELFKSSDVETYSSIFNAELLEIYYPYKNKPVKVWGISILYALFTFFYAVYKKMYKCAIITVLIFYVSIFLIPRFEYYVFGSYGFLFFPVFFSIVGCIAIYLFYVFSFDRLLLEKRKNKINYYIRTNPGVSKNYIESLVIEDNKNNIKGLIITIILTIIFIIYKLFLS